MSRFRCRSFRTTTWSSKSRRQLPPQRSATSFCHGLRKAMRVGWLPMSLTAETTSAPNFESRSNSKNRCGCLKAHASRNCCATQRALGFRVTLKCRILRRSWPMTKKQYRTPNVSVGTVRIRFHSNHFTRMRFPRLSRNLTHSRIRRCGCLSSPRFTYFNLPISCSNFHTGLRMHCRTV
jgi:hypothetical protein